MHIQQWRDVPTLETFLFHILASYWEKPSMYLLNLTRGLLGYSISINITTRSWTIGCQYRVYHHQYQTCNWSYLFPNHQRLDPQVVQVLQPANLDQCRIKIWYLARSWYIRNGILFVVEFTVTYERLCKQNSLCCISVEHQAGQYYSHLSRCPAYYSNNFYFPEPALL
jgi:hypothetical protein